MAKGTGRGIEVGTAYMPVLPDMSKFSKEAEAQLATLLRGAAKKADDALSPTGEGGKRAGTKSGKAYSDALTGEVKRGAGGNAMSDALTNTTAARGAGTKSAGGFITGLKDGVKSGWSGSTAGKALEASNEARAAGGKTGGGFVAGLKAGVKTGWSESAAKQAIDAKVAGRKAGDDSGEAFGKGFKKEVDKAAKKGGKDGDGMFGGISAGAKKAALGAAALAASAAVAVKGISDLTAKASDLNETQNKSDEVWKKSAATVNEWAATSAKAYGLNRTEFLDYASDFGNMWLQIGADQKTALKQTEQAMKQNSDISSFYNADLAAVSAARMASYRGEYDSIQKWIPSIKAATVEQAALAATGKTQAKTLTDLEKAKAVDILITKQMGSAAGDFNRTRDEGANKERIFKASLDDSTTAMGQAMLPAREWVFGIGAKFLDWAGVQAPKAFAWFKAKLEEWKPTFEKIGNAVRSFWEQYAKPALAALDTFMRDRAIPIIKELWAVAGPIFKLVGDIIWTTFTKVAVPALKLLWSYLNEVMFPVLEWLYQKVVKPVFTAIGTLIKGTWDNVIKPAFGLLGAGIDKVGGLFNALKNVTKSAWDGIVDIVKGKINSVLKFVNMFIGGINKVAKLVGLKGGGSDEGWITQVPLLAQGGQVPAYARGGRIPGPAQAAGVDNLIGLINGRHPVGIASGEWVIPNPSVAQYGNRAMESVRRGTATIIPGMADGGVVPDGFTSSIGKAQNSSKRDIWQALQSWVQQNLPGAVITSTTRPGANDYHGQGQAIDFAAPMTPSGQSQMLTWARIVASAFPNALELIHTPLGSGQLKNGKSMPYWGAGTAAAHYNHVHWAMGAIGEGGLVGMLKDQLRDKLQPLLDSMLSGLPSEPPIAALMSAPVKTLGKKLLDFIVGKGTEAAPYDAGGAYTGGGAEQWRSLALRALSMTGQPASYVDVMLRRIQQESGGNASAINLWDSNAAAGMPSKGLLQTIQPTFNAYAMPGYNSNIYDPLSNMLASIRYAVARYPNLGAAYGRPGGYALGGQVPVFDAGGTLAPGLNTVYNGTGGHERLVRPEQGGVQVFMAFDGTAVREVSRGEYDRLNRYAARLDRQTIGAR